MESMFKKTEIELELLNDTDMLLMFEKGIRGGCVKQYVDILEPIINT